MSGANVNSDSEKQRAPLPACAAVIVAAGSSSRMGAAGAKQFLEVAGKTILRHCLEPFLGLDELKQIVVVLPAESADDFRDGLASGEKERVAVAAGGPTRQESVFNGLAALDEGAVEAVAIHDAARPLVKPELVRETLRVAVAESCGAVACQPVQDTVKRAAGETGRLEVETTVFRENLWLAQTPQSFPLKMILQAHRQARERNFQATDDAALFEWLGMPVRIVPSDSGNIKVTTPADLPYLEYQLARSPADRDQTMRLRVGEGYDVHRLVEGRALVLGGVAIPHEKGLLGHSDADVLLHAAANALLGAAALGDIGTHFPDTDERYRDADSASLLRQVVSMLEKRGFRVVNLDATVIAQSPKLAPYIDRMRGRIAEILSVSPESVSVKATTHEGLGALGRAEGIAARACALVQAQG